ncbi:FxsB family cyclophane-forming radical SAM/SPASM peptide maturase [Catellatospora sichuanensis]|uniref:FxsB family cyclophane-forming radical SAM/SPASM peptide maturase n=1 Tax=Catellatospora sichuanensis TaxID=1969805 RepID=UPI0011846249|nr:FxsB family cyclophane-forming radical SAM/SPASM peptide maturase [Catellatospora sichuanensis]
MTTPPAGGAVATLRQAQRAAAPWPYAELDPQRLRAAGWRPTPIRELVLKVHQRCNLACDYCYVYESSDQTWRDRPAVMADGIWQAAVGNLARHAATHGLRRVRVVLHGGEPLLFRLDRIEALVGYLHARLPQATEAQVNMQTNGVLLTRPAVARLAALGVTVGVSVDGAADDHDRHRRTHAGRGSFAAVARALDLLREPAHRPAYAGILTTVAPDTDPVRTFEALSAFEPPVIDFLLPHANWGEPPTHARPGATPYADWLIAVFDRWYGRSEPVRVRLFDDILALLLGGASGSEQVGLSPAGMLVVESDGALEQVDALKSAYPGAAATGLDVRRDELDTVFDDPGVTARQLGADALSETCGSCPVRRVCGGGHYAHRYRPGAGFRNPSVYCEDMRRLIDHMSARVTADLHRAAVPEKR